MKFAVGPLLALAFTGLAAAQSSSTYFWHNLNTGDASDSRPYCLPFPDPKHSNRGYFIIDGVATWKAPPECAWRPMNNTDTPPLTFYTNYVTNITQWERPDALAWVKMDRTKPFFLNTVTNETTRITPPEVGFKDEQRNATYYKAGNVTTWEAPPEAQWHKAYDEKRKRDYFFNDVLKESVWVVPAKSNLAWKTWYETVEDPIRWEL